MVTLDNVLGTVDCRSCGRAVDSKHFLHVHDEDAGRCDWLCLSCWTTVAAWAALGAVQAMGDSLLDGL